MTPAWRARLKKLAEDMHGWPIYAVEEELTRLCAKAWTAGYKKGLAEGETVIQVSPDTE
jgi:predicted transcriptional regulator